MLAGFNPSSADDKMNFFLYRTEGDGTFGTKGFNSMKINITHSPMYHKIPSHDNARSPLPLATGGDMEDIPKIIR